MNNKIAILIYIIIIVLIILTSCNQSELSVVRCGYGEHEEIYCYYSIDLNTGIVDYYDTDIVNTEYNIAYAGSVLHKQMPIKYMVKDEIELCRDAFERANLKSWKKNDYWDDDYGKHVPEEAQYLYSETEFWFIEAEYDDGDKVHIKGHGITPNKEKEFIKALNYAGVETFNWYDNDDFVLPVYD